MKLFSYPTAPSARRARIFLAEKGVPVEIEDVDLRAGQHLSSAYLRKPAKSRAMVLHGPSPAELRCVARG